MIAEEYILDLVSLEQLLERLGVIDEVYSVVAEIAPELEYSASGPGIHDARCDEHLGLWIHMLSQLLISPF